MNRTPKNHKNVSLNHTKTSVLLSYQSAWPEQFTTLSGVLMPPLALFVLGIEHVGSTAIPGLAAKPILDIDVVLKRASDFDQVKFGLESLGYTHHGNQGIPDREVFKRAGIPPSHEILDSIAHHLYVCPPESAELKRHLFFRNYLRQNPDVRDAYEKIKFDLAAQAGEDRKKYAALKETLARPFFDDIYRKLYLEP